MSRQRRKHHRKLKPSSSVDAPVEAGKLAETKIEQSALIQEMLGGSGEIIAVKRDLWLTIGLVAILVAAMALATWFNLKYDWTLHAGSWLYSVLHIGR